MSEKQKYWIGPGFYGTGKDALKPNDPIPKNWPKNNYERFKHKIGEKIEVGQIEDVAALKAKIKKLNPEKLEALENENLELTEKLEAMEKENLELTENLEALEKGGK